MQKFFLITSLLDKLQDYLMVRGDQLKVEVMARIAKVLAYAILFILMGFLGIFLLIFAGFTFAIYLNDLLASPYMGYVIVTGIILVKLIVILILLKSGKIQKWLEKMLIKLADD